MTNSEAAAQAELAAVIWGPDPTAPRIVSFEPGEYDGRVGMFAVAYANRVAHAYDLPEKHEGEALEAATARKVAALQSPGASLNGYADRIIRKAYREHKAWSAAHSDWDATAAHEDHMRRRLSQEATTDPLTSLMNRRALSAHLDESLRWTSEGPDRAVAVLVMDLDEFKALNDSLTHEVGDELLINFSGELNALQEAVRDTDIAAARPGGDEFVLVARIDGRRPLLPGREHEDLTLEERVYRFAERVSTILNQRLAVQSRYLREKYADHPKISQFRDLGVSVGVAWGDFNQDRAHLLRGADKAMYDSKTARKEAKAAAEEALRQERILSDRARLRAATRRALAEAAIGLREDTEYQSQLADAIDEFLGDEGLAEDA